MPVLNLISTHFDISPQKTPKIPQKFFRLRRAILTVEMTKKSTVLAPQAKNFSACGAPKRLKTRFLRAYHLIKH